MLIGSRQKLNSLFALPALEINGTQLKRVRRGGLMVSALDLGASGPGSSPGRVHCVVFLGKTLYSHGASLHLGV